MYLAKTDRTEEIRVQREPTGALKSSSHNVSQVDSGKQTLNLEPVSLHWDYEQIMTQIMNDVNQCLH